MKSALALVTEVSSHRIVPVRKGGFVEPVDFMTAFVYCHVTDQATVAEIAQEAGLSIDDVLEALERLTAVGAVELDGVGRATLAPPPMSASPQSGIRLKGF